MQSVPVHDGGAFGGLTGDDGGGPGSRVISGVRGSFRGIRRDPVGQSILHIFTRRIEGSPRIVCTSVHVCQSTGPKTRSSGGPGYPRFERVFNRMGILTQSLYARARIGIV